MISMDRTLKYFGALMCRSWSDCLISMCLKLLALFLKPGKDDRYICLINFLCADVIMLIQLCSGSSLVLFFLFWCPINPCGLGIHVCMTT